MMAFDTALLNHSANRRLAHAARPPVRTQWFACCLRALHHLWKNTPAGGKASLNWPS